LASAALSLARLLALRMPMAGTPGETDQNRGPWPALSNRPDCMKLVASILVFIPKKEGSMTNQDDEEKRNMRIMWIASGVVVLFIVGLMGLSMLGMLGNPGTSPTDMSSQSRTAPTQ
jgi:hypothetical protein